MSAIHTLNKEKIIILIAHSLITLRNFDTIFLIEHGELVSHVTYEELLRTSISFKKMVEASE